MAFSLKGTGKKYTVSATSAEQRKDRCFVIDLVVATNPDQWKTFEPTVSYAAQRYDYPSLSGAKIVERGGVAAVDAIEVYWATP